MTKREQHYKKVDRKHRMEHLGRKCDTTVACKNYKRQKKNLEKTLDIDDIM